MNGWAATGAPIISTGAAIYVRHYLLDGRVALDSPFLLDQQSLEQTRRKWAKRAVEKEKYNNQIENYRRQTIARMKQHLAHGQIAEAELDGLKVAFENGHQNHPELKAVVTLERPSSLTGLGALQFRGSAVLAARAVGHSGGDDAWEHWLAILVGYLLENDERGEYIAKQRGISHSGDSEEKVTEIYEIDQLSKASALCCSWLKGGMPASEEFSGKQPTVSLLQRPSSRVVNQAGPGRQGRTIVAPRIRMRIK